MPTYKAGRSSPLNMDPAHVNDLPTIVFDFSDYIAKTGSVFTARQIIPPASGVTVGNGVTSVTRAGVPVVPADLEWVRIVSGNYQTTTIAEAIGIRATFAFDAANTDGYTITCAATFSNIAGAQYRSILLPVIEVM